MWSAFAPKSNMSSALMRCGPREVQSSSALCRMEQSNESPAGGIAFGDGAEQLYLLIYGTGIRGASTVTATMLGHDVPVLNVAAFAGRPGKSDDFVDGRRAERKRRPSIFFGKTRDTAPPISGEPQLSTLV